MLQKYADTGLGTKDGTPPRCVKLPPDVDVVVCALGDRSGKLRQWIIEGALRDGLLSPEIAQKYLNLARH